MPDELNCPSCGAQNPVFSKQCSSCGATLGTPDTAWKRQQDKLKTLWVVCVVLFWISLGIQLAVYVLRGEPDLVLMSIVLGLLVLGVVLKIRLQLHERKTSDS